ncbi:MAG: hypothetical protein FWG66_00860 [Spirochaetes bacterium]|nr:hypothetical protein [Spirochaetota bacterium]
MGGAVFTFTDIQKVPSDAIGAIFKAMSLKEIAGALNHENLDIRKRFYEKVPSMDALNSLKAQVNLQGIDPAVKLKAQEKMLAIIAEHPAYKGYRFQSRFNSFDDLADFLMSPGEAEEPYGFGAEAAPASSFFHSSTGERSLEEIRQKNIADGCESFPVPGTKIQLINFSECPHCGYVYSAKELADYYTHPRLDPAFKKGIEAQMREDARMFCKDCETYFLPSLLVLDGLTEGVPKNEVQFLCKMQTINAIEDYYESLGFTVLTRNESNFIKSDGVSTREARGLDEHARQNFLIALIHQKDIELSSKIRKGIRNDVFLKELRSRPCLMGNLLQHSSTPETAMNLILGMNVEEKNVIFGLWH